MLKSNSSVMKSIIIGHISINLKVTEFEFDILWDLIFSH